MIVVTGIVELDSASIEAAAKLAAEMAAATRAEAGCLSYAFYQDIEAPGRFRVYEEWESLEALQAHFQTDHMARFNEEFAKLSVLGRDIKRMQVTDSTPL